MRYNIEDVLALDLTLLPVVHDLAYGRLPIEVEGHEDNRVEYHI